MKREIEFENGRVIFTYLTDIEEKIWDIIEKSVKNKNIPLQLLEKTGIVELLLDNKDKVDNVKALFVELKDYKTLYRNLLKNINFSIIVDYVVDKQSFHVKRKIKGKYYVGPYVVEAKGELNIHYYLFDFLMYAYPLKVKIKKDKDIIAVGKVHYYINLTENNKLMSAIKFDLYKKSEIKNMTSIFSFFLI